MLKRKGEDGGGGDDVMGRGGGMGRQSCDDKGWYFLQNQKIPAKGIVSVHEYSEANTVSVSESKHKFRSVLVQVALLQMMLYYVVLCDLVYVLPVVLMSSSVQPSASQQHPRLLQRVCPAHQQFQRRMPP